MIPNPYPGLFVVFDGLDGCGKTVKLESLAEKLYGHLPNRKNIVPVKEPGKDRFWGAKIYEDLVKPNGQNKINPYGFQTWYACDSKENLVENIIPALRRGEVVLADRYRTSMVFGAATPDDIPRFIELNQSIIGEHFIWPDLIFIFDISVNTALERLGSKSVVLDEHERSEVLVRVRKNYLALPRFVPNCVVINSEGDLEEVYKEVERVATEAINRKFLTRDRQ